jgi:signal-transduction protein with cAMP-binding, CBS, and nucleotidyltransferase domain
MQEPPLTVKVGEDSMQVKARMESENLRWSMLTEDGGHYLGWITCDDLEAAKPIREVVIPPTVTATPNTPLNEALSMIFNSAIGTLAILNDQEQLVGVVSFGIIRESIGQDFDSDTPMIST